MIYGNDYKEVLLKALSCIVAPITTYLTAIPVLFDEMSFLITLKVNINFTSRHAGVRNRIFSGDNMRREGRQLRSRLRWTVKWRW